MADWLTVITLNANDLAQSSIRFYRKNKRVTRFIRKPDKYSWVLPSFFEEAQFR